MNSNTCTATGRAGLSTLFPPRRKEDSLHDHVIVLIQRTKNDFFRGMDDGQLASLPDHVRPLVPVTEEVYWAFVTKSVRCRCRKLVYAYEAEEAWGDEFREKLDKPKPEGGFGTLEAVLKEAERLWRENSPDYRGDRAVSQPGKLSDGRANVRRTRLPEESEADYRRRLRERRHAAAVKSNKERAARRREQSVVLWQTVRPAIHALCSRLSEEGAARRELEDESVQREIARHVEGYTPPQDDTSALADLILLE
ncbi:PREDICTED: uncharacterized protein LOC109483342 [Branchiostoma belcheri]|uniref:Uncharacterized protein LOC109483342 n=1 Tax=Branchiostoma belcheri TaxID=7741 RepID=A0A6P5AF59_BRABE|nr:PREDICTED: uncharacterized protein LOC109483342 [Branchiostoma belcheri]